MISKRTKQNIELILKANAKRGGILVLGAWGMFMNDPKVIAKEFRNALSKYPGMYNKIVFSIPKSIKDNNYEIFMKEMKI